MSVLRRHKAVHLAPEERQWFACTHCEKKYILKINLEHHIEDNHNDSRSEDALQNFHKCSICGYQTRLMSSFERHQKTHLAREEREMFPCSYCDKKYVSKGSLESHLGNNHIDSRKYGERSKRHVYSLRYIDANSNYALE
ncbi:PR domain zinc finger protein 5-like [Sitophilus oryzae]|uniref:PR domain zinc finger protein 5-like n=1 Tax=Sitophilus oryzae TaxID=7048 RepID=A0A6J2XMV4_SITOR|nr:PR domain zinc finger protein 5-like [Sitophilus oryzae]